MNVVIDGDSVALRREDNWTALFAERFNANVTFLATDEALPKHVKSRLVLSPKPDVYIIQLGQWASHKSDSAEFTEELSSIVMKLHEHDIKVILCTPTLHIVPQEHDRWSIDAVKLVAKRLNTGLVDFYGRLKEDNADQSWFWSHDIGVGWVCHLGAKGSKRVIEYFDNVIQPYGVQL